MFYVIGGVNRCDDCGEGWVGCVETEHPREVVEEVAKVTHAAIVLATASPIEWEDRGRIESLEELVEGRHLVGLWGDVNPASLALPVEFGAEVFRRAIANATPDPRYRAAVLAGLEKRRDRWLAAKAEHDAKAGT